MTIFIDFNGTILDDLSLTYSLLNELLIEEGHKSVSLETYLDIFTFPIKTYYEKAGFDFKKHSFEELAERFIKRYQPASLNANLHDGLVDAVKTLKDDGHQVVVLSASKKDNLIEQLKHFNMIDLFDDILGIEDIYASSKIDLAKDYVSKHGLDAEDIIMVGDTLHDAEVAEVLGCKVIMYSKGHQAKHRFAGLTTIDHFNELERKVKKYE